MHSPTEHHAPKKALPAGAVPYKWKPGQSGNPSGRPKRDLASELAVDLFLDNPDVIYKAMLAAMERGDARVFQILAERGFGKLTEKVEHSGDVAVHCVDRLLSARKRVAGSQDDRERES